MNRPQQRQQQASEITAKGEQTKTSPRKKKMLSLKKLMMLKNNKKIRSLQAVLTSSPFRWKSVKVKDIHHSFVDNVVFKFVLVAEGVVLVSTVCFFFLCCGCHF